ncbi:MAG: AAA family ATPase [Streptococcus sp.]
MTDGQGRTVSFKDTIIIMTSNAGTGKVKLALALELPVKIVPILCLTSLEISSAPEFMNRFDGIIEFSALSKENLLLSWTSCLIMSTNAWLITVSTSCVTEKVKEKLVDLGYDPKMGARPLRRTIQDHIEDAITDFYLKIQTKRSQGSHDFKGHITIKSAKSRKLLRKLRQQKKLIK